MENVKIFVASSSELNDERKKCIEIFTKVNKLYSHLTIEPVEWEIDVPKGSCKKRIQDEINPLLDECAIVIVLFYSKVGDFTLEEYNLAVERSKKVFVYFKLGFSPKNAEENKKYAEIFKLREELKDKALYEDYSTIVEFESKVTDSLNLYLSKNYAHSTMQHKNNPSYNFINRGTHKNSPVVVGTVGTQEIHYHVGEDKPPEPKRKFPYATVVSVVLTLVFTFIIYYSENAKRMSFDKINLLMLISVLIFVIIRGIIAFPRWLISKSIKKRSFLSLVRSSCIRGFWLMLILSSFFVTLQQNKVIIPYLSSYFVYNYEGAFRLSNHSISFTSFILSYTPGFLFFFIIMLIRQRGF